MTRRWAVVVRAAVPVTEPASELVTLLTGVERAADEAVACTPFTARVASLGTAGPGSGMDSVGAGMPPRLVTPRPKPPDPSMPDPPRSVTPRSVPPIPDPPMPDPPTAEPTPDDTPPTADPAPPTAPPTVPPTLGTPTPRSWAAASVEPRQCNAPTSSAMPMVRITLIELGKRPPPAATTTPPPRRRSANRRQDFDRFKSGLGWPRAQSS